ncbi:TIGR04086 family membrane protein [Lederbergia sp. NSJ-179]|uniref:TIGR04086 family membrane protein n=1 Tax=Lederbergia sp. NSJ-179 TaxID=2931402 RepID=UPI001FD461F2|nr:TIGR04086 family membrane protein [Lederbergia sp. NSJ-179]MCJ7839923.1 TIGR04086 family membrane protein [Lederbergia sp. NSJ-179]
MSRRERIVIEIKNFAVSIVYGLITILLFGVLSSLIFSLILQFSGTQEKSISLLITIISFFAVFFGGFISGGKRKQKGWLIGGATGLLYSLIILAYQFLGQSSLFSIEQFIYHICYILTATMGGVLGVNILAGPSYKS